MSLVRDERPQDLEAIRHVNRLAFAREDEARLVDRLRSDGFVVASLVAMRDEQLIGHIMFSALPIRTPGGELPAASLAPVAVLPAAQRSGVGSELIRKGLEACRARGCAGVLVLGRASYYPRFGFSAELARRISSPFSGTSWMALELKPGALAGVTGSVQYPTAFGV